MALGELWWNSSQDQVEGCVYIGQMVVEQIAVNVVASITYKRRYDTNFLVLMILITTGE